jgi:DNA processing protein
MSDAALIHGLRLARTENVGPITYHQLMARYGSAAAALAAIPELAQRGGLKRKLTIPSTSQIEDELAELKRQNATVLLHGDAAYPPLLQAISDAPPVLIIKGHAHLLNKPPLVAMVGARNASLNGRRYAEKLARELGEAGIIVVSGLAAGIDACRSSGRAGHWHHWRYCWRLRSCLPAGKCRALCDKLRAQGAIVNRDAAWAPPSRPICSPVAIVLYRASPGGTLVVEAAPQSGSLITARLAGEQGREVMAIPARRSTRAPKAPIN